MSTQVETRSIIGQTIPLLKYRNDKRANIETVNTSPTTPLIRQILLSKITFNISRGHFSFVYEMLKSKSENNQIIGIKANANELVANSQMWLQLETNQQNKKFLNGKTPLILCSYIKENEWVMKLTHSLFDNGAHLTLRDHTNGLYPLHYACALLKSEQIEFYLNNLSVSLANLKDFNGNTPVFYLMVSFAFYLNRIRPQTTSRKLAGCIKRQTLLSPFQGSTIVESNHEDRIYEHTEIFQTKVISALKVYIRSLKHASALINTTNRLGLSLNDLYNHLINAYPNLENNEFFQIIKNELVDEYYDEIHVNKINEIKSKTNSTCSSRCEKRQALPSHKLLNPLLNSSLMNNILQASSQAPLLINTSRTNVKTSNYSNNYNILTANILNFGAQQENTSSKINIEAFLKTHLLISLSEMKNNKLITHSKKIDSNLLYLFTNKQTHSRYNLEFFDNSNASSSFKDSNLNSTKVKTAENSNKNFKNCSFKDFNQTIELFNIANRQTNDSVTTMNAKGIGTVSKASIDFKELQEMAAKTNFSWRDSIGQIYENLSDNACDSYRKGIKITYDLHKEDTPQFLSSISKMGGGASRANMQSNLSFNRRTSNLSKTASITSQHHSQHQKGRQS